MEKLAQEVSKAEGRPQPLSWQTVQQWEKEGGPLPNRKRLPIVAAVLGVPLREMMVAADFDVLEEPRPDYVVAPKPPGIPVVGTAQLGDNGNFYEFEYPVGHGDGRIAWPTKDENAYSVRCKGDSMKPRIRHGEFAVLEPGQQVTAGDEVLVRAKDGRVMIKQFAYEREGVVYLDSVNEAHPRISIPAEQIDVMHYLAGIAKRALWRPE
jgi:phage repressor protein C with HTH and peptisase S24 domain